MGFSFLSFPLSLLFCLPVCKQRDRAILGQFRLLGVKPFQGFWRLYFSLIIIIIITIICSFNFSKLPKRSQAASP